jgi:hypothetical protein
MAPPTGSAGVGSQTEDTPIDTRDPTTDAEARRDRESDLRCLRPGWSRSNPFRLEPGDKTRSAGYHRPFHWDFSRIPEQACELGLPLEAGARVRRLGPPRELARYQGTVEYVAWPTVRMVHWDDGVREYVPLRNLVDLEESVRLPKPPVPRYVRKPKGKRVETERTEDGSGRPLGRIDSLPGNAGGDVGTATGDVSGDLIEDITVEHPVRPGSSAEVSVHDRRRSSAERARVGTSRAHGRES